MKTAQNILAHMAKAGITTQGELADRAGVRRATMSEIMAGQNKPRLATLMKLATALGCDVSALTDGEGPGQADPLAGAPAWVRHIMSGGVDPGTLRRDPGAHPVRSPAEMQYHVPPSRTALKASGASADPSPAPLASGPAIHPTTSPEHTFPFAGSVTAGHGLTVGDPEARPVRVRPGLVAIRVEGQSAEPVAWDGQVVLADPTGSPRPNDLVVVQADGEAYLKRFCGERDGWLFLASVRDGIDSAIVRAESSTCMLVVGVLYQEALK